MIQFISVLLLCFWFLRGAMYFSFFCHIRSRPKGFRQLYTPRLCPRHGYTPGVHWYREKHWCCGQLVGILCHLHPALFRLVMGSCLELMSCHEVSSFIFFLTSVVFAKKEGYLFVLCRTPKAALFRALHYKAGSDCSGVGNRFANASRKLSWSARPCAYLKSVYTSDWH